MVQIKILCLDQSTKATGYSVWTNKKLKAHGTIYPDTPDGITTQEKSLIMTDKIEVVLQRYKPDCLCIEDTQFQQNVKVLKSLAQLQGEIIHMAHKNGCGVIVVEPSMWKSFAGIKSRKRKEQKEETIQRTKERYGIDATEDEADAISIGEWAVNNLVTKRSKDNEKVK